MPIDHLKNMVLGVDANHPPHEKLGDTSLFADHLDHLIFNLHIFS